LNLLISRSGIFCDSGRVVRRAPIDHDIIIDKGLNVHIVFGSMHPPGRIFTYIKYIPAEDELGRQPSIWRFRGVPLRRVLERYSVYHAEKIFSKYHREEWDPVYGSKMPSISYLDIIDHLLPEERGYEVYTNPRDPLEEKASELIENVMRLTGIRLGEIGVGGSMLGSFHSIGLSDIDLIVYGCRNAEEVYWKASEIGIPLSGDRLERWVRNAALLHDIPLEVARDMYSPYRRILFQGVETTFVFPEDPIRYGEEISINLGRCVEAKLVIDGGQCRALQYPSRVEVTETLETSGVGVRIDEVISYEGTYSPILYRGGVLKIYGLIQRVLPRNIYRIAVGTRECRGYIARIPE
jgi:predicted nucleotidyltransferase